MKLNYINNGNISNLELNKTNSYSNAFTTLAPLQVDAVDKYTLSLLLFNESVITDKITSNIWKISGNPTLNSNIYKFNSCSLYLNGSSYIYLENLSINSDFTIEFFAYPTSSKKGYLFGGFNSNYGTSGYNTNYWFALDIYQYSKLSPCLILYANDTDGNKILNLNNWNHLAVTYSNNLVNVFLNGNIALSKSISVKLGGSFSIGTNPIKSECFTGYIDEFRISNIVRYTSNFNPPEYSFLSYTNTNSLTPYYSNMSKII